MDKTNPEMSTTEVLVAIKEAVKYCEDLSARGPPYFLIRDCKLAQPKMVEMMVKDVSEMIDKGIASASRCVSLPEGDGEKHKLQAEAETNIKQGLDSVKTYGLDAKIETLP